VSKQRLIIGITTFTLIALGALISEIFSQYLLSKFVSVIFTTLGLAIPILQVFFSHLPKEADSPNFIYNRSNLLKFNFHRFEFLINPLWAIFLGLLVFAGLIVIGSIIQRSTPTMLLSTNIQAFPVNASVIEAITWSPDGKYLASGSSNGTVGLWKVSTGDNIFNYCGHSASTVWVVTWSPDGKHIALGSDDGTVQVWNAVTRDSVLTYSGHTKAVNAVTWSPDGKRIASGSDDGTVQVWDAITGDDILIYHGHTKAINAVAWSPDGKHIASGSDDGTVQVWDSVTGKTVLIYQNHTNSVKTVAWSPDGKRIASGSDDGTVQVWNAVSGHLFISNDTENKCQYSLLYELLHGT